MYEATDYLLGDTRVIFKDNAGLEMRVQLRLHYVTFYTSHVRVYMRVYCSVALSNQAPAADKKEFNISFWQAPVVKYFTIS